MELIAGATAQIRRPEIGLFAGFQEFVREMTAHGESLWSPYLPKLGESPEEFISRLARRETEPEPPLVPETIYWAVLGGEVVGRISLRHRLEGALTKIGGHIGYEVRPSFRGRGIAKEMLKQILKTPEARKIGRLLLTCSPKNPASSRTILANGGKLEKTIFVDLVGEERNHYWIVV